MKIYCKKGYKSFKDLMESAYDAVYSKEKNGFTADDVIVLGIFSIALDKLYADLMKSIKKDVEEDE